MDFLNNYGYVDNLNKYYDDYLKNLKEVYSGRGLMGSSFYQKPYDEATTAYNDYMSKKNNDFMTIFNNYINNRNQGLLPYQQEAKRKGEMQSAASMLYQPGDKYFNRTMAMQRFPWLFSNWSEG